MTPDGAPTPWKWVFTGLLLSLLVYELVALGARAPGATISELVWQAAHRRPIVPFAVGLLCGHFFWR